MKNKDARRGGSVGAGMAWLFVLALAGVIAFWGIASALNSEAETWGRIFGGVFGVIFTITFFRLLSMVGDSMD